MDALDAFPHSYDLQHPHYLHPEHIRKTNIPSLDGKEELINRIQALLAKNHALEEQKLSLQGTVINNIY
jgi:hypothetical protein